MNWEPRVVVSDEVLDPGPVLALAALFDDGIAPPGEGDTLPPLWHWVALPRWPVSSSLGVDGHPRRGDFLPPVSLPRRMFAGGRLWFHRPLRVGSVVRRESTVVSVTEKSGRSGPLVVVVVETRLFDDTGELAVEERQDLIYREGRPSESATAVRPAAVEDLVGPPLRSTGPWSASFRTDPSVLMRFSAASANPHRIHYDWPYAAATEGYPGLVVHGPLMTLALAEMLRLEGAAPVASLEHRNHAPLFCGQPAHVGRTITDDGDCKLTLSNGVCPGGRPLTSLLAESATSS